MRLAILSQITSDYVAPSMESYHPETAPQTHLGVVAAGVENYDVGTEGLGDLLSSVGKWFGELTTTKLDGEPDNVFGDDALKNAKETIGNPEWVKGRTLRTDSISATGIVENLSWKGNTRSENYLGNIERFSAELLSFQTKYVAEIKKHAAAVTKINATTEHAFVSARDEAALDVVRNAYKEIKALPSPSEFYLANFPKTLGDYVAKVSSTGECTVALDGPDVNTTNVDPIRAEQFAKACALAMELLVDLNAKDSKFWMPLVDATYTYPALRDNRWWDSLRKQTESGTLWRNYCLSCVDTYQYELLVESTYFPKHYNRTIRGLLRWISRSIK